MFWRYQKHKALMKVQEVWTIARTFLWKGVEYRYSSKMQTCCGKMHRCCGTTPRYIYPLLLSIDISRTRVEDYGQRQRTTRPSELWLSKRLCFNSLCKNISKLNHIAIPSRIFKIDTMWVFFQCIRRTERCMVADSKNQRRTVVGGEYDNNNEW